LPAGPFPAAEDEPSSAIGRRPLTLRVFGAYLHTGPHLGPHFVAAGTRRF
jgi:hypothetical protein